MAVYIKYLGEMPERKNACIPAEGRILFMTARCFAGLCFANPSCCMSDSEICFGL
jgi:hypothetical protein